MYSDDDLSPSYTNGEAFNDSDIIITRSGHSEIERPVPETRTEKPQKVEEPVDPDVVFVPNEATGHERYEGYTAGVTERKEERMVTETSNDVVFINGKNNENVEKPIQRVSETRADVIRTSGREKHSDVVVKRKNLPLDCSNVICNNTLESLCGKRTEDSITKFRLFRNECYFRKVNCAFRDEWNRYTPVEMEKCDRIAAHIVVTEYVQAVPILNTGDAYTRPRRSRSKSKVNKTRRSFKSRRSQSMDINGLSCQHECPRSCTDAHVPQCALARGGQTRVFLNHCQLDYDSCVHGTEWHVRPLYECVGKRSQVEQNKGLIAWMRRSGIIDKRGRLVKSRH